MTDSTRFSPSLGTFFPTDIRYASLPDDLVDVPLSDFEQAMRRAPGETLAFVDGRVTVIAQPAPPREQVIAGKRGAIKRERDRRMQSGFAVDRVWFHSDADSRLQHLILKDRARDLLLEGGSRSDALLLRDAPIEWKTMDGGLVIVTAGLAFDIVSAAAESDALLFATAERHLLQLDQCEQPLLFDELADWPPTFAEREDTR